MTLRVGIILWFMALTGTLLGVFGLAVYYELRESEIEAVDAYLLARSNALLSLCENEEGLVFFEADKLQEDPEESSEYEPFHYEIRTIEGRFVGGNFDNAIVVPVGEKLGSIRIANNVPARFLSGVYEFTMDVEDQSEFEYPEVGKSEFEDHKAKVTITVIAGTQSMHDELSDMRDKLIAIASASLALSALLGWFLASRITKPLAEIAVAAREIRDSDLSRKVIASRPHDEIGMLAATLNDTFDFLRDGIERQKRFTADVSHEIRTPTSIILNQAEVALRKERPAEDYRHALSEIVDAAKRLSAMQDALLFLAKIDSGNLSPRFESFDLNSLINAEIDALEKSAAEKGLAINLNSAQRHTIKGDRILIGILVRNLVSNAIRYSPEPGAIDVSVEKSGEAIVLIVKDQGVGIPEDKLANVFDRFYRVDEHRSRSVGGTGLGLAIVREIVTLHKAMLEIYNNNDGTGITTTVTFGPEV
ncbi:MAG: ATP-binding protein [Planctomycetes bacterium]|nr:ATP-binding protein [Planctomycetota bacterium]